MTDHVLALQLDGTDRVLALQLDIAPPSYSISGTITADGSPLSGVTVTTGSVSDTTDGSGEYTLTGLADGSYTITPTLSGYIFTPENSFVSISGSNSLSNNFSSRFSRLAGDAPDGLILSNGVPVVRQIRVFLRSSGEVIEESFSNSDGSWEILGAPTGVDLDLQVMGTEPGEKDLFFPKVRAT